MVRTASIRGVDRSGVKKGRVSVGWDDRRQGARAVMGKWVGMSAFFTQGIAAHDDDALVRSVSRSGVERRRKGTGEGRGDDSSDAVHCGA